MHHHRTPVKQFGFASDRGFTAVLDHDHTLIDADAVAAMSAREEVLAPNYGGLSGLGRANHVSSRPHHRRCFIGAR